jgi:hypothetical protein
MTEKAYSSSPHFDHHAADIAANSGPAVEYTGDLHIDCPHGCREVVGLGPMFGEGNTDCPVCGGWGWINADRKNSKQ